MNDQDLRSHPWRDPIDNTCQIFGALLGIGGLISGIGGAVGAGAQAGAEKDAVNLQKQIFQQTQKNLSPFIQAGPGAVSNLQSGLGTPTNPGPFTKPFDWSQISSNPGYQFILQQGLQGITDQASATGGIGGGNTLKALMNYGQGAAAQYGNMLFGENLATQQNAFSDFYNLAALSENAAAGLGNTGVAAGANIADSLTNLGTAQAGLFGKIGNTLGGSGGLQDMIASYLGSGGAFPGVPPASAFSGMDTPGAFGTGTASVSVPY
jgi:hypothetical protein